MKNIFTALFFLPPFSFYDRFSGLKKRVTFYTNLKWLLFYVAYSKENYNVHKFRMVLACL